MNVTVEVKHNYTISVENGNHKYIISGDEYRAIVNAVEQHARKQEVINRLNKMVDCGDVSENILTDQAVIDDICAEYDAALYEAPEWQAEECCVVLDRAIEACSGVIMKRFGTEGEVWSND